MRNQLIKRLLAAALCLPGLLLGGVGGPGGSARADGVGADLIHNETRRYDHPDVPGSVDSSVVRDRAFGFWQQDDGAGRRIDVDGEHESYELETAGGRGLIASATAARRATGRF